MPDGFRGLAVTPPDYWAPLALAAQFRDAREETIPIEVTRPAETGACAGGSGRRRLGVGHGTSRLAAFARRARFGEPRRSLWRRRADAPRASHPGLSVPAPGYVVERWVRRDLRSSLLRLRADLDDRLRQRRQPAARARPLAPAGDRHPAVAWRVAPAHHPTAPHGESDSVARGGDLRRCRRAAPSRRRALCGDHHAPAGDRPVHESVQPDRPHLGLACVGVPGGWRHRVDGVLRACSGPAGHPRRPGARDARRTDKGRASARRAACADRHAGRRFGAPVGLCRRFSARRRHRRDEESGCSERRAQNLARDRITARRTAPGAEVRSVGGGHRRVVASDARRGQPVGARSGRPELVPGVPRGRVI